MLIAFAMGAGLGVSGAVLQRYLNNHLADPFLLGLSGGAVLGSVGLSLVLPVAWLSSPLSLLIFNVLGALFGGMLLLGIILFARRRADPGVAGLILLGVVLNAVCAALTMLLMAFDHPLYPRIDHSWLVGRVESYPAVGLALLWLFIGVGLFGLWKLRRLIERAPYGQDFLRGLGLAPQRGERILLLCVCLIVSFVAAYGGSIGFVGLMVPHFIRPFCRSFSQQLVGAFFAGGALLVVADLVSRVVVYPRVLPVGVITSLVGALVLGLVLRTRSRSSVYGV